MTLSFGKTPSSTEPIGFWDDQGLSLSEVTSTLGNYLSEKGVLPLAKTKVEKWAYVQNIDDGTEDLLVDFYEDGGYFLVGSNGHIKKIETDCDISELWESDGAFFYDKSLWSVRGDEQNRFVPTAEENAPLVNYASPTVGTTSIVEYGDLATYLVNKYDNTPFTMTASGRLSGLTTSGMSEGYTLIPESVFVINDGQSIYSEGNCGLVSIANAMSYYSHYGSKTLLPAYNSTTAVYPYSDPAFVALAATYGDGQGHYYQPKDSTVYLDGAYAKLREYAIAAGYVVGGLNDTQTSSMFCNTAAYYGYTGGFSTYSTSAATLTQSVVMGEISNGRPFQFNVTGDASYGDHGMMGTGYRLYSGEIYLNPRVTIDVELFCVSVYDGWSQNERWIDVDRLSSFPVPSGSLRSSNFVLNQLILS